MARQTQHNQERHPTAFAITPEPKEEFARDHRRDESLREMPKAIEMIAMPMEGVANQSKRGTRAYV